MKSERTVVPPVTAERSPPDSRMTGADSPVIAEFVDGRDALNDVAVAGDDFARLDQDDVAETKVERVHALDGAGQVFGVDVAPGGRVGARPPQRVGLRLAAAFGHRLGEIGEQHGEPEPGGDLAGKRRDAIVRDEVADEKDRHHGRNNLGHEDDGVLGERARIELAHRVDRGGADDLAVEQALRLCFVRHGDRASGQNVLPPSIR